jgi:hypothetical protein
MAMSKTATPKVVLLSFYYLDLVEGTTRRVAF